MALCLQTIRNLASQGEDDVTLTLQGQLELLDERFDAALLRQEVFRERIRGVLHLWAYSLLWRSHLSVLFAVCRKQSV